MDLDVTVAVCTFGGQEWADLAKERAMPSARGQAPRVIHVHAQSLCESRNKALELVNSEYVVYLDADDELEPGYIDAMAEATADVRFPMVRYVRKRRPDRPPGFPRVAAHEHDCTGECLPEGNFVVIGACARTQLLRDVGGWRDFPWSEDWSTWLRCHLAGASFEPVHRAVYRAWVREDSRNRGAKRKVRLDAHRAIYEDAFGVAA